MVNGPKSVEFRKHVNSDRRTDRQTYTQTDRKF